MLPGNLLNFIAFDVMPFKDHTIIRFAFVQNALDVDGGHVHARRRLQLGQRLGLGFAPQIGAVNIESDAVGPREHQTWDPVTALCVPSLCPSCLGGVQRRVIGKPS